MKSLQLLSIKIISPLIVCELPIKGDNIKQQINNVTWRLSFRIYNLLSHCVNLCITLLSYSTERQSNDKEKN